MGAARIPACSAGGGRGGGGGGGGKVSKSKMAEHSYSTAPTFADDSIYLYHNVSHFPNVPHFYK